MPIQIDGIDRRICQTWKMITSDNHSIKIMEVSDRRFVYITVIGLDNREVRLTASLSDLDAISRMVTTVRDRLEALGIVEGLEKIVP